MTTITSMSVNDVRYPTSDFQDGSDAIHADPDYSCVYVVLKTSKDGLEGHGLTFSLGRGNEIIAECVRTLGRLEGLVIGLTLEDIVADWVAFNRRLCNDSQLRWIGPEKGPLHMACGAVVNAVWDMWGKVQGKPLWKLVADMSPEEVVGLVDWKYLKDALTPEDALAALKAVRAGREERTAQMEEKGYPTYTTSAGWLGYSDEKARAPRREEYQLPSSIDCRHRTLAQLAC
jgi:L-fuconate dehydratase